MRKCSVLVFGTIVLAVSLCPAQDKKQRATLEDDWKALCKYKWVHADPKKAWALLDDSWKKALPRLHKGFKEWSKIECSFKDAPPGNPELRYRMTAIWYYRDGDGKEQTGTALYNVYIGLREEKGERYLITRRGQGKIKFDLKNKLLVLHGIDKSEGAMPRVYTGEYKAVELEKVIKDGPTGK
jgi:hypothetical protein